jgi:hypothetical protein
MAGKRAIEENAAVVSFGHTHEAGVETLPNGSVYINSGTWNWKASFVGAGKETWRDLFTHPERFTNDRSLSYVRIDYDHQGKPEGSLHNWRETASSGPFLAGTIAALVAWIKGFLQQVRGG